MNVAFWSNLHENGVSSCTVAAGVMGALLQDRQITIFDNHAYPVGAANLLFENKWDIYLEHARECASLLGIRYGYELLSRWTCKKLSFSTLEIIENHLSLNCCNSLSRPDEAGDAFASGCISNRFSDCRYNSLSFIDTDCNSNLSTVEVLHSAELIVVLLPSSQTLTRFFFDDYNSIISKSVFILNKYNSQLENRSRGLISEFGISPDRLIKIPYNNRFRIAMEEGRMPEFLLKNADCGPESEDFPLIDAYRQLIGKITALTGYNCAHL